MRSTNLSLLADLQSRFVYIGYQNKDHLSTRQRAAGFVISSKTTRLEYDRARYNGKHANKSQWPVARWIYLTFFWTTGVTYCRKTKRVLIACSESGWWIPHKHFNVRNWISNVPALVPDSSRIRLRHLPELELLSAAEFYQTNKSFNLTTCGKKESV